MKGKASAPASKADLAAVKTELKGDIASLKTGLKGDIGRLDGKIDSVKTELKDDINRLAAGITDVKMDLRKVEQSLRSEMHAGFDRITGTLDSFLGKLETYNRESMTTPVTLDRHAKQLKEHASRPDTLEASA